MPASVPLFQVLAERHERRSVIITSNLGLADWTQVFGEPNLTAARLDRLTHKAHMVTCDWKSYRLRECLQIKGISSGKAAKTIRRTTKPNACGGSAPMPPEFIALEATGEAGKEKAG